MQTQIPVDSKILKSINDLNQLVKKIFNKYYIFPDSFTVGEREHSFTNKGNHFCVIYDPKLLKLKDILETEDIICIDAKSLFTTIKDFKKNLIKIEIIDNIIFLCSEQESFLIGEIISNPSNDLVKLHSNARLIGGKCKNELTLEEDVIQVLCDSNMVVYIKDEYKMRLTKELIPNIKPTSLVSMNLSDVPNRPDLFDAILVSSQDGFVSCHHYTCIRY